MDNYLELAIVVGGILHFGALIAGALVPRVLNWKTALHKLDALSRQIVWIHHLFLGLVIVGFGVLSLVFADTLAAGHSLARALCLMIGLFWAGRLLIQFFVFNVRPVLTSAFRKIGYNGLTVVFTYQAIVYLLCALMPR